MYSMSLEPSGLITVEKLILWHIYVKVYILCDLSWGAAGEETVGRLALV